MAAIVLPPITTPVRAAIAEARRHMIGRRLRVTMLILLLAVAATVVAFLSTGGGALPTSGIPLVPAEGSAAMPSTFVASRFVGAGPLEELVAVNAHTGQVERHLTQSVQLGAVVGTRSDVFYVSSVAPNGIYEQPLAGGTPRVLVPNLDPVALALSPDGMHLAWVTESSNNTQLTSPFQNVTVHATATTMNLGSRTLRSWALPMPTAAIHYRSPTGASLRNWPLDRRTAISEVSALGWASNDELAVTTGVSYPQGVGAISMGSDDAPPVVYAPHVGVLPRLDLIRTSGPTTGLQSLAVPVATGFECPIGEFFNADGFLAPSGNPNVLYAYAVPPGGAAVPCDSSNSQSGRFPLFVSKGVDLLRLTVSASQVTVSSLGALPLGIAPTALDHDGHDLLATGAYATGPHTGSTFVARIVAGDQVEYLTKGYGSGVFGESWNGATW